MTNNSAVLVLCPNNMTSPSNGPNGFLGDRIHQLPSVIVATQAYSQVFIWPLDPFTKQVFQFLPVKFIQKNTPEGVFREATNLGIKMVIGLYAKPINLPTGREKDCETVNLCHEIAEKVTPENVVIPNDLDPRGLIPIWQQLAITVRRQVNKKSKLPSLPFLSPTNEYRKWGVDLLNQKAKEKPVIVASPLSGGDKKTVNDQWWRELAKQYSHGHILVPVWEGYLQRANAIFGSQPNISVVSANIAQIAGLSSKNGVHVLGIDGGNMNVMAASRSTGVLTIYGEWPASAWAMPNVVVRDPSITPAEAIRDVP